MAASGTQSWPAISLTWGQRLAAFWLLAWPSWLASFFLVSVLTMGWAVVGLRSHAEIIGWASLTAFLVGQGILVPRMIGKRYRSFRLEVVRPDGSGAARLNAAEIVRVWLRIIVPQALFLVAIWAVEFWLGSRLTADAARTIATLSLWGRVLVVGPFGIYSAVTADYPGFRLQAVGQLNSPTASRPRR